MKVFLSIVLLLLMGISFGNLLAQSRREGQALIDSVRPALARARSEGNDSLVVRNLRHLNNAFRHIAPDSAIFYGKEALDLAEKKGMRYSAYRSKLHLGFAYLEKGDFPTGLEYLLEAQKMAARYGEGAVMSASFEIGNAYFYMNQAEMALPYYREYLRYAQRIKDSDMQARAYQSLSNAFVDQGKVDSAIWFSEKGLALFRELKVTGVDYYSALHDQGTQYTEARQYAKARKNFFEVWRYASQAGDNQLGYGTLLNLGDCYLQQAKDLPPGQSPMAGGRTTEGSARDSLLDRKYLLRQAARYSAQAIQAGQAAGLVRGLPYAWSNLAEAQKLQGQYQAALESYQRYDALKDSLFSDESRQKVEGLTKQQEEDRKARQIEIQQLQIQKAEQRQWFLLAGLALSLVIVGLVVRSQQVISRQKKAVERERERSDNLLLNILPEQTARELKEHGRSKARHHDHASVLFADFKSFSPIAASLNAQELVDVLDHYFSAFDRIVHEEGVEKIKTIGDAYMAVSGVPLPQPDHARRLVRAGQKMLAFVEAEKQARMEQRLPWFELRVGIHSGPLTSGVVGRRKFAFDVWGDTVNLAARLEAHGEPGRLNISEATYALVKDLFPCSPRGPVTVKHGQQVEMYFVEEPAMAEPEPEKA